MEIKYNIDEYCRPLIKEYPHDRNISILYKIDDWCICINMEDEGYFSTSILNVSNKQVITTNSRILPFLDETYLFIDLSVDNWLNYTFTLTQMRN